MKNLLSERRSTIVRARRLMTAALVLSVMGNRLVEGGFDGLASAGLISVGTVVTVSTLEQLIVLTFPVYARILRNTSPNWSLVYADTAEVVISALALIGILASPAHTHVFVIGYVLLDLLISPVSDIADELYGSGLAARSGDDALAFNTSVDSMLAFFGFVVFAPLGSKLAGVSAIWLLGGNIFLSGIAIGTRLLSGHTLLLKAPRDEVELDEYAVIGQRSPVRQFVHDLLRSGPASPLLTLLIQVAGALTGQLLFLWIASLGPLPQYDAMAVTLLVFGLAATIGPQAGRLLARRTSSQSLIYVSALASFVIILFMAVAVWQDYMSYWLALACIFFNVVVARARLSILNTHRQVWFSGRQFERIMGWSYAFGGLGTIIGLQLGYLLHVATSPLAGLCCACAVWLIVASVRVSQR